MDARPFVIESCRQALAAIGVRPSRGPVIAAVSGGADSVALLVALVRLGYGCVAVHCNFHLRGDESDRDERYVVELCREMGVECVVEHFDVPQYAADHKMSVEMACRELRYELFERIRAGRGAQAIAVAHHRDDNAETFFLNLMRRTGVTGLAGMKPRNGHIVRPLLGVSRADVEAFLAEAGIGFVTDHTNLENTYRRNRVRNMVMPSLREAFGDADEAIATTMAHLRDAADFIRSEMDRRRVLYMKSDGALDVDSLVGREGNNARYVLFELMKEQGITADTAASVIAAHGRSGRIFAIGETDYLLDRGLLRPVVADTPECESREVDLSEAPFEMAEFDVAEFDPRGADAMTAYFDVSVLHGNPRFELRHWREGDRLEPFGMKGSKKLSDIFNDAKLPLDAKRRVLLLTRNDKLLWVIGVRASRHFAVTPSSRRFIRLRYNPL